MADFLFAEHVTLEGVVIAKSCDTGTTWHNYIGSVVTYRPSGRRPCRKTALLHEPIYPIVRTSAVSQLICCILICMVLLVANVHAMP